MIDVKKTQMIAKLVMGAAILVLIGWIFDISFLKNVLPDHPAMKFNCALSFLFAGFLLYVISKPAHSNKIKKEMIIAGALVILTIMVPSFFTVIYGKSIGWENLFVPETSLIGVETIPGLPSFGASFAFILFAGAMLISLFARRHAQSAYLSSGSVIAAIGLFTIIGHLLGAPVLYFELKGISNGIAAHAGVLFVLLGNVFFNFGQMIPDKIE